MATVAVIGLLAACTDSGGGFTSATAGATLTRGELVERTDAICRNLNHEAAELASEHADDPAEGYAAQAELFGAAVDDLASLTPPEPDASAWRRFIAQSRAQQPMIEAAGTAFASGTAKQQRAAVGAQYRAAASTALTAENLGLRECPLNVDTVEPPPDEATYVAYVNGWCYFAAAAADGLGPAPRTQAEFHAQLLALDPIYKAMLRDIRAQPAPAGSEDLADAWLVLSNRIWQLLHDMDDAAEAGDRSVFYAAAADLRRVGLRAAREARAAGLTACAQAP